MALMKVNSAAVEEAGAEERGSCKKTSMCHSMNLKILSVQSGDWNICVLVAREMNAGHN